MSPIPSDYVDVAERIREFKAAHPDGSLQSIGVPQVMTVGEKTFIAYCAAAYRTPDDPRPGIGWAWEPVPGPTPFTKDSELMNAETSAWGRAIVALGFETKKIASAQEVENRQGQSPARPSPPEEEAAPLVSTPAQNTDPPKPETKKLVKTVMAAVKDLHPDWNVPELARTITQAKFNKQDSSLLTDAEMVQLVAALERKLEQHDPGPVAA